MVISVTDTNISESSINDLFHKTEISVLELCNQVEIDLVRSSFINEADEGGEEKSSSKFATFIATIKLKIEELARKVTDTIRKQVVKIARIKLIKASNNVKIDDDTLSIEIEHFIKDERAEVEYYIPFGIDNPKLSNCNTVEDFMNVFKTNTGKIPHNIAEEIDSIITFRKTSFSKNVENAKKEALDKIKRQEKSKSIEKEEAIKQIKRVMNWYTACIKACVHDSNVATAIFNDFAKAYNKY